MIRDRVMISTAFAAVAFAGSAAAIFAAPFGPRILCEPPDSARGAPAGGIKALLAKRAGLRAEMRVIIDAAEKEDRDLTAEEKTKFDELKAAADALEPRIARLEEQGAAEAVLDAPRGTRAGGAPQLVDQRRHMRGAEAKKEFENLGEFLAAVRFNPNDQRLDFHEGVGSSEDPETGEVRAELRMDDGSAGGFAIPPQFIPTLRQLQPQDAIVRPRAEIIDPGSAPDAAVTMPALDQTGTAPGNIFGGVQVQWIAEGGLKPPTDMKLREITLTPHEVAGVMIITDKLLRNWQAAGSMIERQLRGAIAQAEDFAFITGSGVAKPLGILVAKATYAQPRLAAGQVQYQDLVNMLARSYGSDAVFTYSKSVLPQLMTLKNPNGQYIWTPSAVAGQPSTLLGRVAIESNRNPILGQPGDVWLADLKHYLIKDGSGPFVAASEHVYFMQNKTVIKAFWNVDGAPWLTQPIQLENGYQASPFVKLDVPSA